MLFVGALALSGCPDPETLGTPRTIPRGQIAHTVALTAIGSRDNGAFGGTSAFSPSLPTYMFRLGLADRVDVGLRLSRLTSLGADAKINFLRGPLDLALDPGFAWFGSFPASESLSAGGGVFPRTCGTPKFSGCPSHFMFHLPLIVGINITRYFSIVPAGGLSSMSITGRDLDRAFIAYGRAGLGFDFRIRQIFALHPEFTLLQPIGGDSTAFVTASLGFSFGAPPDFDHD